MVIDKKGELRRVLMILIVGVLLFGAFAAILSFAQTPEEEKAQLEAELAKIEAQLNVISAGFGVNEVGL